jgi:catalase-peroxidase
VLGGCAAVEKAAKDAGFDVEVPFTPGRTDATAGADRRRVLRRAGAGGRRLPQLPEEARFTVSAEEMLVDKAQLLTLTAPGDDRAGRRPARAGRQPRRLAKHGVFTDRPAR